MKIDEKHRRDVLTGNLWKVVIVVTAPLFLYQLISQFYIRKFNSFLRNKNIFLEKISLNKPQNKIIIFASQLYRHAIYQP